MNKLWLLAFSLIISSCKSSSIISTENTSIEKGKIEANILEERIKKIEDSFNNAKLTEEEANEAFLIAKTFEYQNKFVEAEKLLEYCYKNQPIESVAQELIQMKITLKKLNEAKNIANHASVIYPNNSNFILSLIQIYQIESNSKQTSELLLKAYKNFPNNEQIAILFASYNSKNAKKILEDFVHKKPDSSNALLKLSLICYQQKKYNEALNYAKRSYSFDPDNIDATIAIGKIEQVLKNYKQAELYFKTAFEKNLESNINAQNYINNLLFQNKQQEALSVLLKLEASSDSTTPFPPEFSYQIGRILLVNENYLGAKQRFESLLSSQYANRINQNEVLFYLAYACEHLKQFEESLNYLDKIDKNNNIATKANKARILLHINSRKTDQAKILFNEYLKNSSLKKDDILFKTSLFSYFGQFSEAMELLNKSIKLSPNEKDFYLKRLDTYIKAKKPHNDIIQQAKYLTKKWPNYADGLNLLGYMLVESNQDLKLAEKVLKKAIAIDKQNPFYLDSIGCLYSKKKNLILAQKYFLDALKFEPNEPVILFHYATLLKDMKESKEAAKILEKTRTIISNMLIYSIESDLELKTIAQSI